MPTIMHKNMHGLGRHCMVCSWVSYCVWVRGQRQIPIHLLCSYSWFSNYTVPTDPNMFANCSPNLFLYFNPTLKNQCFLAMAL